MKILHCCLAAFYIDKYEVTNKEYKEFMDSGGYTNSQYWVDMDFISDGISLTEKEAKKLMVDSLQIKRLWNTLVNGS